MKLDIFLGLFLKLDIFLGLFYVWMAFCVKSHKFKSCSYFCCVVYIFLTDS